LSVGETLSRARRKRGLSVDDVSADTRIRATLVAAIEADQFDPCGGAVYARGHIRSIAKVVGIDPEPLVAEFDDAHESERLPVAAVVAPQPTDPELVARTERHRPNWTIAMGVALAGICILAIIGLATGHNGGNHHHGTGTAATGTTNGQQSQPQQPPASPPPSTVAQLPVQRASMLIRVLSAKTWLSIHTKKGGLLFEGLLPAGQHKLFTNKHGLSFIIGNAPAVDLVINGHDIGSPPSSGVVAKGNVVPGADTVQLA